MNGRRDFLKLLGLSLPAAAVAAKAAAEPEPQPDPEPKVEVRTIVIDPNANSWCGGYENAQILQAEHEHIHRSIMESGLAAKLLARDPRPNETFARHTHPVTGETREHARLRGWKPPKEG